MKRTSTLLSSLVSLALFAHAAPARANGFYIAEQSGAGTARSNAVVADPQGPATVMTNPAGMPNIKNLGLFGIELGAIQVMGGPEWKSGDTSAKGSDKGRPPLPHLYAVVTPMENLSAGIGVYAPFGIGVKWPDGWAGADEVLEVDLKSIFIDPSVAYRIDIHENFDLSLGAGFYAVWGAVHLKRGLEGLGERQADGSYASGSVTLGGQSWGFGGHAGLLSRIRFDEHEIGIGFSYRSSVELNVAGGHAHFDVRPGASQQFADGNFSAGITLPHTFQMGAVYKPAFAKGLAVELDVSYNLWSSYDELRFKFDSGKPAPETVEYKDWKDAATIRLGLQYDLPVSDHTISFRTGYIRDLVGNPNATVDPLLPDADRNDVSVGLGWQWRGFGIDFAYMAVIFDERKVTPNTLAERAAGRHNFPGTYNTTLHLVGGSLSYRM